MLAPLLFACSCVSIFFGARAAVLGYDAGVGLIAVLTLVGLMVFVPYGQLVAIAGGVALWRFGQARYFQRVVDGETDDTMDRDEIESIFD